MIPVDLFDVLQFQIISEGIELRCQGIAVPGDERNLVWKAARTFFEHTGIAGGISVRLHKKIPVAAGLGGGSSDAAATLLILNEMWAKPLSQTELHTVALGLGADVPFFLDCRPSLARGIGEILEPLGSWPYHWYLIVTPPIQVSTAWVYGNLKLELTPGEYDYIVKFLKNADYPVTLILENDLEEVTSATFPIINTIKEHLIEAGAEGAMMTGSGPSVFGVFSSMMKARKAKDLLSSKDLGTLFVASIWRRDPCYPG
jgi:4-diphosphocytidyl-2-C-methyl-D-erythritol kinase